MIVDRSFRFPQFAKYVQRRSAQAICFAGMASPCGYHLMLDGEESDGFTCGIVDEVVDVAAAGHFQSVLSSSRTTR